MAVRPAESAATSAALARALTRRRAAVQAQWERILGEAGPDLVTGERRVDLARQGVQALIDLFEAGSQVALAEYAERLCQESTGLDADIARVIEAHLMLKPALLEVLGPGTTGSEVDSYLDEAVRLLVIRFASLYSTTVTAQLQDQVKQLDDQRRQLERRIREVTALMRSGSLILSTLELDRVLTLILEQLGEVVEYDRASILMLIEGRLRIIAARGFADPQRVLGVAFDPKENALTRRLLAGKAPVVLGDVSEEPAFVADAGDPTRSWIGVPLLVRGEVIGALALDDDQDSFYDEGDGATVMAFATQAALAIENARLHDRAREQDVLAERNRLARELHDSLSQSLFSMVLNAEAAGLFMDTDRERARAQVMLLHETANAALKEMRTLIFELRPANLEQEGLAAVLAKHAKLVAERNGFALSLDVRGQRRLPLNIEKALFRVAQEALNNVVKHAAASEVEVNLSAGEDRVLLTIADNGRGFDSSRAKPNTLGLLSMQERVEQLGGVIEIGPRPGGTGTLVRAIVPCDS